MTALVLISFGVFIAATIAAATWAMRRGRREIERNND